VRVDVISSGVSKQFTCLLEAIFGTTNVYTHIPHP
jgi:hypothetical protein